MNPDEILQHTLQQVMNRARERGLRVCPHADRIMHMDSTYSPIAKSIWKNTVDDNEYMICLSASDYQECEDEHPRDWAWKVPGILAFHSGMTFTPEPSEVSIGRVEGTDFYLFLVRFESAPSFSPGGAANFVPSSESFSALTSDRP